MDLDSRTIMVSTTAAPACGSTGTQQYTIRIAAVETIKHGYDKYVILGSQSSETPQLVGRTPIVANTYGNGTATSFGNTTNYNGTATTYLSGGDAIIANRHNQSVQVHMFRNDDPDSANALDARKILGPSWSKMVAQNSPFTCLNN
jgi:hypothetical protein